MRSERLARTLLRVYPRDWRERYGDELLALVAESGLTWRTAVDIAVVGLVERVRRLIELGRAELVPASPLPPFTPETGREFFFTHLGFVALAAGFMLACTLFGVTAPEWNVWLWLFLSPSTFDKETRVTGATIGERIALSFAWFLIAAWIGTVGWIVGDGLRRVGVPEPADGVVLLMLVVPMLAGLVRLLYRGIAAGLNKPRPEIARREWWAWSAVAFMFSVLTGMADTFGRLVWTSAWVWSMWLSTMRTRRVRSARRRELREQRGF